jgi:hypothetical protein
MRAYNREHYNTHKAEIAEAAKVRYTSGKDVYLDRSRNYYRTNTRSKLAQNRAWKQINPHKLSMYSARRRAALISATPNWSIDFFVEEAYTLAKLRSETFGVQWEVDHIVPLVSSRVCGLHAHCNLQVIMRSENARKSNTLWDGM